MKVSVEEMTGARHPIAVVSDRTGLSQDVLRVWERRYGAVQPGRGPGGKRFYTDGDVERLRVLAAVTRAGRAIGEVAALPMPALVLLESEDREAREAGEELAPPDNAAASAAAVVLAQCYPLIRALDGDGLDGVLRRAEVRLGVETFVERLVGPLLRWMGDEWHAGRLGMAHEHLASSIVHDILVERMRAFPQHRSRPRLLVATLSRERHVLGAALVGALAALMGWNVVYLGADLPAAAIVDAALESAASVVAVSVVYVDDRRRILDDFQALRQALPVHVELVAGGAGASTLVRELTAMGIRVESTSTGWLDAPRHAVPDTVEVRS